MEKRCRHRLQKRRGCVMLKRNKKNVKLSVDLSREDWEELKIAVFVISMDTVSGEQTQRGRDGMYRIMEFILPALQDELITAIKSS